MDDKIITFTEGGIRTISSAAFAIEKQSRVFHHLLSGQATFQAIIDAVEALSRLAPDDCDVLVLADNVTVTKVQFIEPHAFSFEGFSQDGHPTWIVQHFSQVSIRVVYQPKRGPVRVITGFSNAPSA